MKPKVEIVRGLVSEFLKVRNSGEDETGAFLNLLQYLIDEHLFLNARGPSDMLIFEDKAESGCYPIEKFKDHVVYFIPSQGWAFFGFDRRPTDIEFASGIKYYQF